MSSSLLPTGYFLCDYIESNGNSYINTGFTPTNNTRVVMHCVTTTTTPTDYRWIFGGFSTSNDGIEVLYRNDKGLMYVYFGSGSGKFSGVSLGEMNIDVSQTSATINGVTVSLSTSAFTCGVPLFIGGNNSTSSWQGMPMKIYSCQIYNGNTLARNYIPCTNDYGKFGLYDAVNGVFYESSSATPFTGMWSESHEPGKGYTLCDYIESSGSSYIDTGFKPNNNTRVVMDVQATSITTNAFAFEGRTSSSAARMGIVFYYSKTKLWRSDYGGNSSSLSFNGITDTERLLIDKNKNVCTINGVTVTHTAVTFQSTATLALLAANTGGSFSAMLKARLYSCQIYDNGTLIRDYVPCMNMEGTYGMLDKVSGVFYTSASSTGFTGKWSGDHELGIRLPRFRRRLMSTLEIMPDYSSWRGVFIEDTKGFLYTSDEWNGSRTPNGIAVLTDNCRFVMSLNNVGNEYMKWDTFTIEIPGIVTTTDKSVAVKDFKGRSNSTKVLSYGWADAGPTLGAFIRTSNYVFPNGNTGYVGAAGEWMAIADNLSEISTLLSKCGGAELNDYYATSTQAESNRSWYFRKIQKDVTTTYKSGVFYCRPFIELKSEQS